MKRSYEISKRGFDFAAAVVWLAVLSPFMLIFYLLVRFTSRGGGFFVQGRAGRDGRLFRMVKFRTMRADHVHDPDPTIVIADTHEAVTPVGHFLRKFKLDELPQLFNVLAGHMSLVGPRPTVPEQVARYGEFERRRLAARPGITGLAQVNGGTGLTWPERIEWDVYYVERRTLMMDLKIIIRTAVSLIVGTEKNVRRFRSEKNL